MNLAKDAGILAVGRITNDNGKKLKSAGATFLIQTLDELIIVLQHQHPVKEKYRTVHSLLKQNSEHDSGVAI
jgi:hypothetical protein